MRLYEEIKRAVEWRARTDSRVELIQDDLIQELYLGLHVVLNETSPESHIRQMIKTRMLSVGKRLFKSLYEREGDRAEISSLEVSEETIRWGVGVPLPYFPAWPNKWIVKDEFERDFRTILSVGVTHFHLKEKPNEENFKHFLSKHLSPLEETLALEVCRSLSKKASPLTYTQEHLSNPADTRNKILKKYKKFWELGVAEDACSFEAGISLCNGLGISFHRAIKKPNTIYFDGSCPLCQSKTKRLFLTWRSTETGFKWNSNCYKCSCKSLRFTDGSRTHSCIERFLAMALA